MPGGTNSVPLGQAGTGAAYILPDSQAIGNISNYVDTNQAQQAAAAKAQQKAAEDLAASWQRNQLNIKAGTLWQPEINAKTNDVMEIGKKLQVAGIDPTRVYNDPNIQSMVDKYNSDKQDVIHMAQARDEYSKQLDENNKAIRTNPDGYFDQDAISAQHDFINQKLSDIVSKGAQVPQLQKAFNLGEGIAKLVPVKQETTGTVGGVKTHLILPDEESHAAIAKQYIQNSPEAQKFAEKQIGMPIAQLPASTDPDAIRKQLDAYYRSAPNIPYLASIGVNSFTDPKYKAVVDNQVKQLVTARQKYDSIVNGIKENLDNRVSTSNDKSYDFSYQREMRDREAHGQARIKFSQWLKDQQNEPGEFHVGNSDSYVPVLSKDYNISNKTGDGPVDKEGKVIPPQSKLEKGSSLFGLRVPSINVTVQPSTITSMDNKSGGFTSKNAEPIEMKVGGIKMVHVWSGLPANDPRNGTEVSARQLDEAVNGKSKLGNLKNINLQPVVYGLKIKKDADNIHTVSTPITIPYSDFKGGDTKKINTKQFDDATEQLKELQKNPKFVQLTPQQQLDFISKRYNLNPQ